MPSTMLSGQPIAHSAPHQGGAGQPLIEHLENVADLAARFGAKFGAGALCRLLGHAHDLGKANPAFQRYIAGSGASVPHSDAGAKALSAELGPLALCVQGHHGGLPDQACFRARIEHADSDAEEAARSFAAQMGLQGAEPPTWCTDPMTAEHLIRMCLSALVDADRLDTERFYSPDAARGGYPALGWYLERLEASLAAFPAPTSDVDNARREVQAACREAAMQRQGAYRLTVPTGGGKTLASMLYALRHCVHHELDRVIIAIPYTSIIDQNAAIFADIFGPENILEHHSGADAADETAENQDRSSVRQRLASENWDCPIVLTTNVQLFESLLHNHPSKTRKLHNVARSVVVLDEVQTLPADLLEPCISVLHWLTAHAHTSVLFCTATQPDYTGIEKAPRELKEAAAVVPDECKLFERLKRVNFSYAGDLTVSELAARIAQAPRCLAILNTRKDSVAVFEAVRSAVEDESGLYLSTLLVPDHRRKVLAEIKRRLKGDEPCRIVSTQVVEAGVDIDLPVVYRVLGPLDSIVQAAGRCNREGSLPEPGRCEVFCLAGGSSPRGLYATAIGETRAFIPERIADLDQPSLQSAYYRSLLKSTATDREVKVADGRTTLQCARRQLDYPTVEAHSKLITDNTVSVVVWSYAPEVVDAELRRLERGTGPRFIARRLANYSASLYERDFQTAVSANLVVKDDESGFHRWVGPYDDFVGIAHGVLADPCDLIT